MKSEAAYQTSLIKKLEKLFPGCYIRKNDPAETQGVPDILILFGNRWAQLEVKLSKTSPIQPNQPYYVDLFNEMSFASFIYPENESEVLNDLQKVFG
jgi:hypothetical protein